MEHNFDFRTKFAKVAFLITVAVTAATSYVAISYAENKTIIINDEEEEPVTATETNSEAVSWVIDLSTYEKGEKENVLEISLPSSLGTEDVNVSARYDLYNLLVSVNNTHESYFTTNPLSGDFTNITKGTGRFIDGTTTFTFSVNMPFLYDFCFENNKLVISFFEVELEEKPVVVIDPGHGGSSHGTRAGELTEKDITLKIAKRVADLAKDKPYRIALTRAEDTQLSTADRITSVMALNGDMYIGLHLSSDIEDVKTFGQKAVYNGKYFRNGLENADFADMVLREVANETSNLALGLFEADDEDVILKVLDIPATVLYCGYMSNEAEALLLSNDEYIEKTALGIVNALDELYKE